MLNWQYKNFIYAPSNNTPLMTSYAQLPTPWKIDENTFRFYFSSRDSLGQSRPFYLDYSMQEQKVLQVNETPILELGSPGCFDDTGIMPSSIIEKDGKLYLYYIGWNQRKNISYQLAIGLAISDDGGKTFSKYSTGPILDRNIYDPIFCAAPCVHYDGSEFVMWYISCTGWPNVNSKLEPVYLVKRATSIDGITWQTSPEDCIPYKFDGEAIGRPWVTYFSGQYHMLYSSRGSQAYRQDNGEHYSIGYASSFDGITWARKDEQLNFKGSELPWDGEMQEYTAVFEYENELYIAYNGNTFGKTGFGIAKLEKDNVF